MRGRRSYRLMMRTIPASARHWIAVLSIRPWRLFGFLESETGEPPMTARRAARHRGTAQWVSWHWRDGGRCPSVEHDGLWLQEQGDFLLPDPRGWREGCGRWPPGPAQKAVKPIAAYREYHTAANIVAIAKEVWRRTNCTRLGFPGQPR